MVTMMHYVNTIIVTNLNQLQKKLHSIRFIGNVPDKEKELEKVWDDWINNIE